MLDGFLVYIRWIVGSCVDRIQKGNSREDEGFQHLISSIQDAKQEFLYESFVQNEKKLMPWYESKKRWKDHLKEKEKTLRAGWGNLPSAPRA